MNNTILRSLAVENFASFSDKIMFTTEADYTKHENTHNQFVRGDACFNKVSFLYGANGSGKTFFCKIVREIQRFLDWSPIIAMNNPQLMALPPIKGLETPINSFAFDVAYRDKPTVFSIDLIVDDVSYHYEFAVKNKLIERELLTKKRQRTEKLIDRTSPSFRDIVLRSELKGFDVTKQVVKGEALCLPVAALLNNPLATRIVTAIKEIQVVSMTAAKLDPARSRDSFSESRLEKYKKILQRADPTLRDIKISFEEEEIARQRIDSDDFENREVITTKTTVGVDTKHAVFENGAETDRTDIAFFANESLGTVKLFTALPYLFDVLEAGGILFVDELENGLHLSLAREIIELFTNEETNPNHAQLICTSHQPLLLDGDYRRDQVWIASKDSYGKSSLHRLSEAKHSRTKVKLSNRILEGAFGCNPDLFFRK